MVGVISCDSLHTHFFVLNICALCYFFEAQRTANRVSVSRPGPPGLQ